MGYHSLDAGIYKGWHITFDKSRPVTGTWRAERFDVGMCNNSRESIMRMVDVKNYFKGVEVNEHQF